MFQECPKNYYLEFYSLFPLEEIQPVLECLETLNLVKKSHVNMVKASLENATVSVNVKHVKGWYFTPY